MKKVDAWHRRTQTSHKSKYPEILLRLKREPSRIVKTWIGRITMRFFLLGNLFAANPEEKHASDVDAFVDRLEQEDTSLSRKYQCELEHIGEEMF